MNANMLPPRYRDPEPVGRGGMGEIFRATDAMLGRSVAIKVLAERYVSDDAVRRRFMREALAAARLSGEPNTVTIYDVGEHLGRPYIVMEYLGGGSLEDVLRERGAQPPERVLIWLEQAARALDEAHREGVVHRDVKPGNLMLDGEGDVHVGDFGIASAAGTESLTLTGTVLGTAGYLSPEQARGERATPASDRYSFAVVAFELLTGARPFEADSPTVEAAAHLNAEVPSVSSRVESLPRELDPVFASALAKDPRERYDSCGAFVAAIRGAIADSADATRELPVASWPETPTTRFEPHERPEAAAWRDTRARRRPWLALLGLLALGIAGGALAAYLLTRGGHGAAAPPSVETRTITAQGRTTTVEATTPVAPPAAGSAPLSGHQLNDAGFARMTSGDFAGAVPLLTQAVAKLRGVGPADPYEAFANYNLGFSLLQLGRCAEAVPYLERAEQLEPERHEPGHALKRAEKCA